MPPSTMDTQNPQTTIQQPEPAQLHALHTAQPPVSQPMSTSIRPSSIPRSAHLTARKPFESRDWLTR
jgi:hypothetical protein